MNRTRVTILVCVCIATLAAFGLYRSSQPMAGNEHENVESAKGSSEPPTQETGKTEPSTAAYQAITASDAVQRNGITERHALMSELRGSQPHRWLRASSTLQVLPASAQWEILNTPGISNQPYARLLRHKMALSCASTLRQLDISATPEELTEPAAVIEWCRSLKKVGPPEVISEGNMSTPATPDWSLDRSAWSLSMPDPDSLSDTEKADYGRLARRHLREASNLQELRSIIDALWRLHDDMFAGSWAEVARLSKHDRDLLYATVPLAGACSIAGGCGPHSLWTINYCAMMPGFQCHADMSLDDAMRWNLSPRVYRLARQMVAEAGAAYHHDPS